MTQREPAHSADDARHAESPEWTYRQAWTVMILCALTGFCLGLAVCGI